MMTMRQKLTVMRPLSRMVVDPLPVSQVYFVFVFVFAGGAYARDEMAAADSMRVVDSYTSVIRDAPRTAHRPQTHRAGFLARLLNS